MYRLLVVILVVFFASLRVGAQENARFRHYTTEDGLSQNTVYCFKQDRFGFMWIGTQDGLNRFDGYAFRIYKPDAADSTSISGNSVRAVVEDRFGNLWIGTRAGLCRYDRAADVFVRYPQRNDDSGPASDAITDIEEDSDGNIWISTLNHGVSVRNATTGKFKHYQSGPGLLSGNDVRGMSCAKNGHMWLSTWAHGICEYDPKSGKFTGMQEAPGGLNYPNIRGGICAAKSGKIYIGTWGKGIDEWDPATQTMKYISLTSDDIHPTGMVWNICEDMKGRIWCATAETGLFMYDPSNGKKIVFKVDIHNEGSINDNNIWGVGVDRSNHIWAGGWQGGVNMLNEKISAFTHFRHNPFDEFALPSATVWSFCSDGGDGLWVGTGAGPAHYDPGTGKFERTSTTTRKEDTPSDQSNIQTLCRHADGRIFMGTTGGGLYIYNPADRTYVRHLSRPDSNSLQTSIVSACCGDVQGNIWVGCGRNLQRYISDKEGFNTYSLPEKDSVPSGTFITCIVEKSSQELYLGLNIGYLYIFNKVTKQFSLFWKSPLSDINTVLVDTRGGLWIGTSSAGLCYLNNGKETYFTEKNGLPNNSVNCIVNGSDGELWLSTNKGICKFDPLKQELRNYTAEDGTQGNEFNQNACYKTKDGQIWFGGTKGITAFYPDEIVVNQAPADAVLIAFTVLNDPYPMKEHIGVAKQVELSWRDYFFSFEYAGMEYTNPSKNMYKYMLVGFDEDWVEAGTRRFVTYTNLDPGTYTFRVMASNNDGVWNGKVAEVVVVINPPFWRTNWFYILCGLTAVATVWLYIRSRERKLRREKLLLENKVNERTSELNDEKEKVTAAHKDIRDSINYAKRIQYALLAHEELLRKNLNDHFVVFRPKDVVSGDFYWATAIDHLFYFGICDSTGHGVPGAFMSLLNISFLNEAIIEKGITKPGDIFNHVRQKLISNVSQEAGKDGMDAVLLCFDSKSQTITYAAAHNKPVIVRNSELIICETDKMPVGKGEIEAPFRTFTLDVISGDVVYLYTDGYADQFGGPHGKKYKYRQLHERLVKISSLPLIEQHKILEEEFDSWKGTLEQVDDVLVAGLRIP